MLTGDGSGLPWRDAKHHGSQLRGGSPPLVQSRDVVEDPGRLQEETLTLGPIHELGLDGLALAELAEGQCHLHGLTIELSVAVAHVPEREPWIGQQAQTSDSKAGCRPRYRPLDLVSHLLVIPLGDGVGLVNSLHLVISEPAEIRSQRKPALLEEFTLPLVVRSRPRWLPVVLVGPADEGEQKASE